ncbi:glycosyltransferase family 4 protein [Comamonas sediminis]|uniref:glycosyltransferase family 4 protein n=1 Tax=Comamonas sediminis TaxID=1783360 RepID=UPI003D2B448E
MRIVIDMQGAQSEGNRHRGIGRYILEFAKAMCRNRREHEIVLALNGAFTEAAISIRDEFKDLISQENICVWEAPGPIHHLQPDTDGRRAVAECLRLAFLRSLRPSVVINGAMFDSIEEDCVVTVEEEATSGYPTVGILYDLIPLIYPDIYLDPNPTIKAWYSFHLAQLKRCSYLLAISESSRLEAIEHLQWPSERISNISSAVGSSFTPGAVPQETATEIKARLGLSKPFVMYTGGMDHRKNVHGLIEAYAKLPDEIKDRHQLVIVGKLSLQQVKDTRYLAEKHGLAGESLVLTGFVSDTDLLALYRLSKLFVFTSWHEGFGLPLLEAMSCGKAVLAANASAMPEVVGMPEALFDANDTDSIAEKMAKALSDDDFLNRLESHALAYSRNFSWEYTAQHTIAVLEQNISPCAPNGGEILNGLVTCLEDLPKKPGQSAYRFALAQMLDRSFPPEQAVRRMFVDVTELARSDARTGIQRVVRSILQQWLRNPSKEYLVLPVRASDTGGYVLANRFTNAFLGVSDSCQFDSPVAFYNGDIFIGLDLQSDDVPKRITYFEQMRAWGVATYFVVYDLLPVQLPECFPEGAAEGHARWLAVIARSNGAMCISRAVADDLELYLQAQIEPPHTSFCIDWFHLGADIQESVPSTGMPAGAIEVIARIKRAPSFLMVGTVEPRKGHEQALDALDILWNSGLDVQLVIVGKAGWKTKALIDRITSHSEYNQRLFWFQGISDEYLEYLYRDCSVLLAASIGEGFGLPLIEAAQRGLPIIARDIPVFREVAGQCAYYFQGTSSANLAHKLTIWLEMYGNGLHPSSAQMPWLTWRQSADQLFQKISNQSLNK